MTRFSTSALFILSVCLAAHLVTSHGHHHDHGHSHHDHDHGHVHEPPSFKYSKQANQEHQHSSPPKIAKPSRGTLTLWVEALGSTLLISAAPFVILFFIPISNKAEHQPLLKVLLSFASGGLLGDAFLHLIPHALLANSASSDGSHSHSHSHDSEGGSHGHDLSVGLGVLGGIVVFLMVEKFVRIVKGDHGHSHGRPSKEPSVEKKTSPEKDCETKGDEREREEDPCEDAVKEKADKETEDEPLAPKSEIADHGPDGDIMVAGYLNLAADFMHNFTDGLAIGASYIAGSGIGLITTMTILLHEVPHEIGDFAILIQSGCSKGRAIGLQLVTAIGALAGTAVSLFAEGMDSRATNLILPFTAGGFIYIATVSVIPDLLEDTNFWQSVKEVIALLVGVFMMVLIAQYE